MTEYERYLFDLNGFLHVEGALSAELVGALNEAIDHNHDQIHIRTPEQSLDGRAERLGGRSAEGLRGEHGRGDFGGYLFWEKPWCEPFRELIAPRPVMRILLDVIGPRFRLTGNAGITMTKGAEGFMLHGGGTPELEHMRECFYHRFEFGRMFNGLVSVSYTLTDASAEDGGFVCIPGSHKANYLCPLEVRRLEEGPEGLVRHIPLKAGDAVIFTEALTHGTAPWQGEHERRLLRYLYSPAIHGGGNERFADIESELDPLQRLMVQPSYHPGEQDLAALIEADPQ
jgi:hypothetical protein